MKKLVVVDDEQFIANSIAKLIQRSSESFSVNKVLYSSEDALHYISNHDVDIMITDIQMPELNGLDLIERVNEINPSIQIIIITGYGTFDYAKQAMQLGVQYIFQKPIKASELMKALEHVTATQAEMKKATSLMKSEILNKYLQNDSHPLPEIEDGFSWFMIDAMHVDIFNPFFLAHFTEQDILSGMLGSFRYYLIYEQPDALAFTDFILDQNLDEGLLLFKQHVSLSELKKWTENGEIMLNMQFYSPNFQIKEIEERDFWPVYKYKPRFDDLVEQLVDSLENHGITESKKILEDFFTDNINKNHPKQMVIVESLNLISKLIIHFKLEIMAEIDEINKTISLAVYYQDVLKQVETILEQITLGDNNEQTETDLAAEINTIIENHYSNPDLSLTWISKNILFFNAEYLGREFSQRVGKKFNTKLTEYRIEQAKKLLIKNHKVYEVAKLVGYENNPEYFNLVFKKNIGTTPLKYSKINSNH